MNIKKTIEKTLYYTSNATLMKICCLQVDTWF